jgi:hypothetical protein
LRSGTPGTANRGGDGGAGAVNQDGDAMIDDDYDPRRDGLMSWTQSVAHMRYLWLIEQGRHDDARRHAARFNLLECDDVNKGCL